MPFDPSSAIMNIWTGLCGAARTWWRTPAIAVAIVLTVTLCIGAATTTFSIAYSTLVHRFPFPDSDRLVWITTFDSRARNDANAPAIASNRLPQFAEWRRDLMSFERIGAWAGEAPDVFTVTGAGTPERISGLRVTHELLPMLGAVPVVGTLFRDGDDLPGAAETVVLSQGYWQTRFGGRPDIIGRAITIESIPHVVIGIVDRNFPLPGSLFAGAPVDLYLPLTVDANEDIGGFMAVIGRLRPGITTEQAQAELARRRAALSTGRWQWMSVLAQRVLPLGDPVTRAARSPVLLLCAGIACVLLMACANLANLLLIRASGRRREMQVKAALGASTRRMLREATTECAVLVIVGGAAGIAVAVVVTRLLERANWLSLARQGELHVSWPAVVFAAVLCAAATLLFGSVSLLHLRRGSTLDELRSHAGITPHRRAVNAQHLALITQIAVVVVLTIASGLLVRSLDALLAVDPGFAPRGVMAIRVDPADRLKVPARLPFFVEVLDRIRALRGVESAALTIHVPMGDRPSMGWDAIPEGRHYDPVTDSAAGRIVSPSYFRTVGIKLLAGRDFDSRDGRTSPLVMAVNETFARQIRAGGGEPLGARFLVLGAARQVVAVISDVKHRTLDAEAGREVYIPFGQAPPFFSAFDLLVRAADPIALFPSIRAAIWRIDRNQALGTPVTMEEYVDRTLRPRRLLTTVTALFTVSALLLASFGIYGVVGYRAAQRTREIAIRVAIGAPAWRVTSAVLRDIVVNLGVGIGAGVLFASWASSALRSQLFGVQPDDALTFAVACGMVASVALIAAYLPARRARGVDPIAVLRAE